MLFSACKLGHQGFSYRLRKKDAVGGEMTHEGRDGALSRTSPQFLGRFQEPADPGREGGEIRVLYY